MTKRAYPRTNVLDDIVASIQLQLEDNTKVSPTQVLQLARLPRTSEMRAVVIEMADMYGYNVIDSKRGYIIRKHRDDIPF